MYFPIWKSILVTKIVQIIVVAEDFFVQSAKLDGRNWAVVVI